MALTYKEKGKLLDKIKNNHAHAKINLDKIQADRNNKLAPAWEAKVSIGLNEMKEALSELEADYMNNVNGWS